MFSLALAVASAAYAQVTTTTTLSIPTSSVAAGVPTLLTATVTDAASHRVNLGTVTFYDGTRSLGSAQIVSGTSGAYPQGTANLKTASFAAGTNSITAVFAGTNSDLKSTSSAKTVTVTATGNSQTTVSLQGYVTGTDFWLPATVRAFGSSIPTGDIDYVHVSDGATIGTKSLSGATWTPDFAVSSILTGFNNLSGQGLVAADFNNDGFLDIANGALSIALGNGDGTFKPTVTNNTGRTSQYAYAGDFNNDGRLDLMIASFQDNHIGILLGNGDGTFQPPTLYGPLRNEEDGTIADLNGDGNLDIVSITNTSHTPSVAVFLGNGDGTFQSQVLYPVDTSVGTPWTVRAGDLNGDGIPDLVVSVVSAESVLLGKGDGTFLPYKQYPLPSGTENYFGPNLALGDVNGDGKLDVVDITDFGSAGVFLGKGDGTLSPVKSYTVPGIYEPEGYFATQPILVDINQDGKLDIAMGFPNSSVPKVPSGNIRVLFGNGDGSFQFPVSYVPNFTGTGHMVGGDFNGDGRTDLVTASFSTKQEFVALNGQAASVVLAKGELGSGTTTVQASYLDDEAFEASGSNLVVLGPNPTPSPNFPNGFFSSAGTLFAAAQAIQFNGVAAAFSSPFQPSPAILLTRGGPNEAGSMFYGAPQNIQAFTTDFEFAYDGVPAADGLTFTIQNEGPQAIGSIGGGLGYKGIPQSVAVKFDLYNNSGEGNNSTGLYTDGASPETPAVDMTSSGLDLHSGVIDGSTFDVHITYDGVNLAMTITDVNSHATFSDSWPVDIPAEVGGTTAYVGFTGGTGGKVSIQELNKWTYVPAMP